tara:strand:+ start:207 stop:587 length:381 start_codon:yes stop_codon:yes gene_type:complete
MGASFTANTSVFVKSCNLDADCYEASSTPIFAAATTDADKKKRCCLSMGYESTPVGTGVTTFLVGDLSAVYVGGMNTYLGMPKKTGQYTKICALDYPKDLPYIVDLLNNPITGSTQSGNTWTVPAT